MILDSFGQHRRYIRTLPRLDRAFQFLGTVTPATPVGRQVLEGENIYAIVQRYTTKPMAQARFEAHRRYADVQFIVTGREKVLWAPLESLRDVAEPYSTEKDITFFDMVPEPVSVDLRAGQFAVFFPEDGHAPGLEWASPGDVLKVVVKVRVETA